MRWLWLLRMLPGRQPRRQALDATLQALIKPPVVKFAGADEGIWERTKERREAANKIRARAAKVETGAPVSDIIRRVK